MKLFLSPLEISNELEKIVIKKAESTIFELLFFGILAGIYIGFGAQASLTILSGKNVDPVILKFLAGSVFSVGLMLVLIPGAELFTGNILMCLGLIDRKYNLLKLIRNWVVVYIGNFIGSVFLSYIVLKSGVLGSFLSGLTPIGDVAVDIAILKINF
ncbi:MAG TPA: formate/nitrite transporter family protein [Candidatus Ratteibacteria bacterium]|nr:formate/nitrite transporter family protein [Candidatus Ratteibacteria bacterium]